MVSLNSCRRQLLFFVLYLLCICNAFIRIGSLKHSNSNSYNSFRVTVNNNQHKDSNSEQKYVNNNNIVTDRHDGLQNLQSFTTRTIAKTIQKILVPIVIGTIPILHSASITNAASEIGTKPIAKAEKDTYSILEDPFFEKSIFNLPPGLTPYPSWLAGTWSVNYKFVGAQFTEQFPYRTLASNVNVPGFRKYSVAYLPDIGKETTAKLRFVNGGDGIISEDRVFNLKSIFQSFMNDVHAVVDTTSYDSETNANRCSLAYHDDKGSGKIELFSNSRTWRSKDTDGTFQTAENIRQVINLY